MVMTRLIHTTLAVQLGTTAELALWTHQVVFLARARQMQLMPGCDSTYATSPAPSVDSSAVYHQSRYLSCCFRKCMSSFPDTEMVTTHVSKPLLRSPCNTCLPLCTPAYIYSEYPPPPAPPPFVLAQMCFPSCHGRGHPVGLLLTGGCMSHALCHASPVWGCRYLCRCPGCS